MTLYGKYGRFYDFLLPKILIIKFKTFYDFLWLRGNPDRCLYCHFASSNAHAKQKY